MRKFEIEIWDDEDNVWYTGEYVEAPTLYQAKVWANKWRTGRRITEIQTAYND